jgi:hypothetical protein
MVGKKLGDACSPGLIQSPPLEPTTAPAAFGSRGRWLTGWLAMPRYSFPAVACRPRSDPYMAGSPDDLVLHSGMVNGRW